MRSSFVSSLILYSLVSFTSHIHAKVYNIGVISETQLLNFQWIDNVIAKRINANWRVFGGPTSENSVAYRRIDVSECTSTSAIQKICTAGDIYGLVVSGSCSLLNAFSGLGTSLNLLTILVPTDFCDISSSSEFVYIMREEDNAHISAAVAAFDNEKAENVAIIYDTYQDYGMIQSIQNELSRKGMQTTTVEYKSDSSSAVTILQNIVKHRIHHILAVLHRSNAEQIITDANSTRALEENYFWLFLDTSIRPQNMLKNLPSRSTMANLVILRSFSSNIIGKCSSASETSFREIVPNCDEHSVRAADYHVWNALESLAKTFALLENSSIPVSTANTSCDPLQNWTDGTRALSTFQSVSSFDLQRTQVIYNTANRRLANTKLEYVGSYTKTVGEDTHFLNSATYYHTSNSLQISFKLKGKLLLFPNTFVSFKNKTLIYCSMHLSGYSIHTKNPDGSVNITGQIRDMLDIFERQLDFKIIVMPSPDGLFGAPVSGSPYFSGCIGQVQRRNMHLSGPFAITKPREEVIDFSQHFVESSQGMMVKMPQRPAKIWNVFAPLHPYVWGLLFGTVAVSAIVTFLLAKFSPFTAWNLELPYAIADEVWLQEYFWSIIGSFMQQGQDFYPFAMSARTMLAFWWMFTVIIFGTYTGDLTAYLTITKIEYPIQTLEDVVARPHFKALVPKHTNLQTLLEEATSGIYSEIIKQMVLADSIPSCISTVVESSDPNQVCIGPLVILSSNAKKFCNDVYLASVRFNAYHVGMAYQEDAYYAKAFDDILMGMRASGMLELMLRKHHFAETGCVVQQSSDDGQPIAFEGIAGAVIIIGALYVLGLIFYIFEFVWSSLLHKNPLDLWLY